MQNAIIDLVDFIQKNKPNKAILASYKIKLAKKHKLGKVPSDIELLLHCPAEQVEFVRSYLTLKPVRLLSGVSVIAVMTPPHKCPHGKCITCPGGPDSEFGDVPQSYTGKEPATRRAIRNDFDPYLQVFNRLEQYYAAGHLAQKIELIIMGGTFPSLPIKEQDEFIVYCYKALNDFAKLFFSRGTFNITSFKTFFELPGDIKDTKREAKIKTKVVFLKGESDLIFEQKKNETSAIRSVGLTIETRSDYARKKHIEQMLKLGCTRVELGVQSVYDDVLKFMERGHTIRTTINSIRNLKDYGFKVNAHYMPGLIEDREMDLNGMIRLFEDSDYQPDMVKIYPCMVLPGTKLYIMHKKGKFNPLTTNEAADMIAQFKKYVPEYCRIMRVQRDIPSNVVSAGVDRTNLRQYVQKKLKERGLVCRCIRCREIKNNIVKSKINIKITEYQASKGTEYFIAAECEDYVLGFCRLRFPSASLTKEITEKSALVRELHVYGEAVPFGKSGKTQHTGIGRKLLHKAEIIAKKNNKNKLVIISGIGVREYYRRLGYQKQGPYMVKKITDL